MILFKSFSRDHSWLVPLRERRVSFHSRFSSFLSEEFKSDEMSCGPCRTEWCYTILSSPPCCCCLFIPHLDVLFPSLLFFPFLSPIHSFGRSRIFFYETAPVHELWAIQTRASSDPFSDFFLVSRSLVETRKRPSNVSGCLWLATPPSSKASFPFMSRFTLQLCPARGPPLSAGAGA